MTITCPICNGSGRAPHRNGVDPQKPDLHTCFMCEGTGKVEEVPTSKPIIHKYWFSNVVE
jgi:DnaJ-class molecular chaperone